MNLGIQQVTQFLRQFRIIANKQMRITKLDPFRQQGSTFANSKKTFGSDGMFKQAKQKQTLLQYLQTQMKMQGRQQSRISNAKNKIRLPLIASNKTGVNSINEEETNNNSEYRKTIQTKNGGYSSNPNHQRQDRTLQVKKNYLENPIFINIKAVVPTQKTSAHKKKDHSLRDLRILRREKQQGDYIMEDSAAVAQQSRAKLSTVVLKRKKIFQKQSSPLKPTGDKRTSQRSSMQKISSGSNKNKRAFSINQNKKKYAVTYSDFCTFVSSLNKIRIQPPPVVFYRAFVGKGNNSILVKNAIKNRFWWNIMPEKVDSDINFLWLQSRDNEFINQLNSSKTEQKTSEQKNAKRLKYHLQSKNEQKLNQNIKQFVHQGFCKLISQKQSKQGSFTPYFAETASPDLFPDCLDPNKIKIHNHLEFNWNLTNKKALFYNLKTYYELIKEDPFKYIPLTFHVKQFGDDSWNQFKGVYQQRIKETDGLIDNSLGKKKKKQKKQKANLPLWIIKPGQNTNQGCGIQVSDSLEEIVGIVKQKIQTGKNRSSIIQKYLMPFLYNKRKFDIRCYMLTTCIKGTLKGYWYQEGYIRTSSKQFTTKNLKNRMIHLTNDAIQKKSQDYGKYQNGNKISFGEFQKHLDNNHADKKLNFFKTVYPQMMKLAKDALTATYGVLDGKNRQFTFQVFGLDFMIDEEFNTWLIQVNNNPCLQLSSPLLARIVPNMIQNAFKIAIDPLFPPPLVIPKTKSLPTDLFQNNKYTLVFDSSDIEQGFQNSISKNKVNLDKIIQGQQQDEQLDEDDQECCGAYPSDQKKKQSLSPKKQLIQTSKTTNKVTSTEP